MMHIDSNQNMTQKEAFRKYLETMDIEMLELILDDTIPYFGASKKVFLEKLSYIFNQVRLAGYKGDLKIKQHKKHANTYFLPLKIFGYSNKFIIEENEGVISKIYSTKIKKTKKEIEDLHTCELVFGVDEKKDFKPSVDYIMKLHRCNQAYEELINDEIKVLTSADIFQWLKKHKKLYGQVKEEYQLFKYNKFRNLFSLLKSLFVELVNYNKAKEALDTFDDTNMTTLHDWIVDYYDLAFCKVLSFNISFSDTDLPENILKYSFYPNIYFKGDDFFTILKFNRLYQNNFSIYHHNSRI